MNLNTFKTKYELNQTYFHIHRIDENVRTPDWKIEKTDRPYTVFWYVISGTKIVKINNVQHEVQKGDLVVFPSQLPFEILEMNTPVSMHHLEIAIENKLGPFNLMTLYKFPAVTELTDSIKSKKLIDLWMWLKDEWTPARRETLSSENKELKLALEQTIDVLRFNALTIDWFVEVLTLLRPYAAEAFPTFDPRLQHLFYFINDHLADKLNLKVLANEVFLSESHLSLLFRQNLKMSPMGYVRKVRMQKARELLLTTDLPMKEIAEFIGFDDQSQLSRAFRQTVGISPAQYRRNGDFI
ncbi:AraC family transcriptional regulator [Bacillus sp. B190/17]|uniref:AraC family transcriptional regulator n=1 Tax=Bacillus lumedeiriae TaxID=3058829 RepID=A0ABW8IBL8_9BACI